MSFLELDGQRHLIPVGEIVIGTDPSSQIRLSGAGVAPQHAILQGLADGQVAIRKADDNLDVLINGVRLGPQPTPLLHGDKVEIGGDELLFVDERQSGSTQYVQALDPAALAAMAAEKPAKKGKPTAATGGRLVCLTDGREYTMTGGSLVIGRDAGCDVVATSRNVSRRHAEIMATPKGYVLVDSSTNGTFINAQRIEGQQLLARADVIRMGDEEFRFYADVVPVQPEVPVSGPEPAPATPVQAPSGPPSPPQPAAPPQAPVAPPGPAQPPSPPPGAAHRLGDTLMGIPGAGVGKGSAQPPLPVSPRTGEDSALEAAKEPSKPAAQQPATPAPAATGAPKVLAVFVVKSGALRGQRLPIRVPLVNIGRAEYNDIVFPDDSVSTMHAKLQRREGIWVLVDLEATNGTFVDGEPVEGEVPLAPGALVRFGEVKTFFEPTDDTIDPAKGSSTKLMGAIKIPPSPPPEGGG